MISCRSTCHRAYDRGGAFWVGQRDHMVYCSGWKDCSSCSGVGCVCCRQKSQHTVVQLATTDLECMWDRWKTLIDCRGGEHIIAIPSIVISPNICKAQDHLVATSALQQAVWYVMCWPCALCMEQVVVSVGSRARDSQEFVPPAMILSTSSADDFQCIVDARTNAVWWRHMASLHQDQSSSYHKVV